MLNVGLKTAVKRLVGRGARALQPPWRPDPGLWGLSITRDVLTRHGVALAELAARYGTPLHVVDFAQLERNARDMLDARGPSGEQARVFYSYKTNPVPGVLSDLHRLGVGAEVVSPYELWLARELGVPGADIIYNGPVKSAESLAMAIDLNVACLNANSLHDLHNIGEAAAQAGRRVRVGLRVTLGAGWHGQFGFAAGSREQAEAIAYALAHEWLDLVGLHAHRGAWMRSAQEVRAHVEQLMAERDRLGAAYGLALPLLDVGGSLACPTVHGIAGLRGRLNRSLLMALPANDDATLAPGDYARIVLETVAACASDRAPTDIVVEPGRGLTGNAQHMLCTVLDIKHDPDGFDYAIVDAGIHNAESMRDQQHAVLPLSPRADAPLRRYRLTGPLCRPDDVLCYSIELPQLKIGDRLAIMDTGAYFIPLASAFSFGQPAVVGLGPDGSRVLREHEHYADIVARDRFETVRP